MSFQEWLEEYKKKSNIMCPESSLEKYFIEKTVSDLKIEQVSLGNINISSGKIIVCDPVYFDSDADPLFDTFPKGEFPVTASILVEDKNDPIIILARIKFSDEEAVKYREGLTGKEDLDRIKEQGDYIGFNIDSSICCFIDDKARKELAAYVKEQESSKEEYNLYNDFLMGSFQESVKNNPKYQHDYGDWANIIIPNSSDNIIAFSSGYGEAYYPVYIAEDKNGNICQLIVQFVDLELEAEDEDDYEDYD